MRWIVIPGPVDIENPDTDCKVGEATFANAIRSAFQDPRLNQQGIDIYELIDARAALIKAKEGDAVPLPDDVHKALELVFTKPTVFAAAYIFNAKKHIDAVRTARDTAPTSVGAAAAS